MIAFHTLWASPTHYSALNALNVTKHFTKLENIAHVMETFQTLQYWSTHYERPHTTGFSFRIINTAFHESGPWTSKTHDTHDVGVTTTDLPPGGKKSAPLMYFKLPVRFLPPGSRDPLYAISQRFSRYDGVPSQSTMAAFHTSPSIVHATIKLSAITTLSSPSVSNELSLRTGQPLLGHTDESKTKLSMLRALLVDV